ncbi:MAG TPA: phosphatase PAP2 family protein [Pirellulales bacterium]|jgi:acid phosphatase (class A)|nr:phosphatase PAP2 family protein [Pirellulales bacterium]
MKLQSMKLRTAAIAVALSLTCAIAARAERPSYFSPSAVDAIKLLPGFPAADSDEAHEELLLMRVMQRHRTEEQVARCESEVNLSVDAFKSVLGPWCTSDNLPQLSKLFKALAKDSKPFSDAAKDHFKRPRPAKEDPQIHVPIKNETTYAYPSGHSTRGTMYALILAELAPAHREALLDRGREIGWDRVVAGLHHPSDIYGGRVFGQALAESLLADPKFKDELAVLKKELADAEAHAKPAEHAADPNSPTHAGHHAAEPAGAAR